MYIVMKFRYGKPNIRIVPMINNILFTIIAHIKAFIRILAMHSSSSFSFEKPMNNIETVKKIILKEAGKQFHPGLAWAFVSCVDSFPKNLGAEWEAQAGKYFCTNKDG